MSDTPTTPTLEQAIDIYQAAHDAAMVVKPSNHPDPDEARKATLIARAHATNNPDAARKMALAAHATATVALIKAYIAA